MLDQMILLAQAAMLAFAAAWLSTGVFDNMVYPRNNEAYTSLVLSMERLRDEFPDEYATVAHRAITSRDTQRLAFRLVVVAELVAAMVLWLGAGAILLAMIGTVGPDTARALGLLGALLFTSVWAAFLVVGNYFCYWFCHEGAQNTHYQMTLWGLGTMVLLAVGG